MFQQINHATYRASSLDRKMENMTLVITRKGLKAVFGAVLIKVFGQGFSPG